MQKVIKNPDIEKYNEITKAVENNDGYCPCYVFKNENTKCMCKPFTEAVKEGKLGPCHCGRYINIEVEESKEYDIEVKMKLENGGILPVRKTSGAAAYDCYANAFAVIKPGERALVSLGFAVQVPDGYCLTVLPRSGNTKNGIDVGTGTVDSDYRGIVHACVINNSDQNFTISSGDRICQVRFEKLPTVNITVVDELDETERGAGGFGHTGVR